MAVEGRDSEGHPYAFIKAVLFKIGNDEVGKVKASGGKQLEHIIPTGDFGQVDVRLEFHSHYGEPPLDIPVNTSTKKGGPASFSFTILCLSKLCVYSWI